MPGPSLDIATSIEAVTQIPSVQKLLEVVCRSTGLGFAAVARVTDTQWVACSVRDEIGFGLQVGGELELQTTICDEIRQSGELVVIDHVATDPKFANHHTPRMYGFQSYISVPIYFPKGEFFGTLCAIDPNPGHVNNEATIGMFNLFAELIAMHMDVQSRLDASEVALTGEREVAKLQELFVGVLGHDLRNPLAAIQSGADMLAMAPAGANTAEIASIIHRSVARITEMVDNLLDLTRGRLGGGIPISKVPAPQIEKALLDVVNELRIANPDRDIQVHSHIETAVEADEARLGQLLSNLVGNAVRHGDRRQPILVEIVSDSVSFKIDVENGGPDVPPQVMLRLFEPFARGTSTPGQGLGLGLYISTEIARAHGGTLVATSGSGRTRFSFLMPLSPDCEA